MKYSRTPIIRPNVDRTLPGLSEIPDNPEILM
jgi:hypothetical protein